MQVPASIYGQYPEVKRRMRRMVTRMKRGASFEEALGIDQLIDTAEHEGIILLLPASRNPGRQDFHPIYVLDHVLGGLVDGIFSPETEEVVFNACLRSAWGVLLLLPHNLCTWVKPEHRWLPFLQAAARFWPLLEAEGARYWTGGFYSERLTESCTTINYVLGHAGIYLTGIGRPLPPDWPALVEAYTERRKQELH
jgi:hypothetical protein